MKEYLLYFANFGSEEGKMYIYFTIFIWQHKEVQLHESILLKSNIEKRLPGLRFPVGSLAIPWYRTHKRVLA